MLLTSFDSVSPREIAPGFHGRYVHSDQVTIGQVDIDPGAILPEHAHPHEQWTTVLSGALELTVDGVTRTLTSGQVLHIPAAVVHSGRARECCRVLDVFHPAREDYRGRIAMG
jgi:quercetin dioxygenase-like cupin family protein